MKKILGKKKTAPKKKPAPPKVVPHKKPSKPRKPRPAKEKRIMKNPFDKDTKPHVSEQKKEDHIQKSAAVQKADAWKSENVAQDVKAQEPPPTLTIAELIRQVDVETTRCAEIFEALIPTPTELSRANAAIVYLKTIGRDPANPVPTAPPEIK